MTNNTQNICYVCLDTEKRDPLVKPCSTLNCSAVAHDICIEQQYQSENLKCGICRAPVIKNSNRVFNTKKCCISYIKLLYTMFMVIGGSILLILLSLGTTVKSFVLCGDHKEVHPCDTGAIGTILLTLPYILLFFQIPWGCCRYNIFCCLKDKPKYKPYLTMGIMFFVSSLLILLAHGIGYPIIKHMFGMDVFFTWRTSLAGTIVYAIIIGTILICSIVLCVIQNIHKATTYKFTETEVNYGTLVEVPQTNETIIDIDPTVTPLL